MIDFKAWLSYDAGTGLFRWLRASGKARIGDVAGTPHTKGYVTIGLGRKQFLAHRLAWLFVYGSWPEGLLDHRDTNKTNNRIANLREATNSQNHANRGAQKNSTSGIKGVYFFRPKGKWKAQIVVRGASLHLGYFETKGEAADAYDAAANKHFGDFAHPSGRRRAA